MRKVWSILVLAIAITAVLIAVFFGLNRNGAQKWAATNDTQAFASYDQKTNSVTSDASALDVGGAKDASKISFFRLPLEPTYFANEIKSARLYLKIKSGATPKELNIGSANSNQWLSFVDYSSAASYVSDAKTVKAKNEGNGWISVKATVITKEWIGGDKENFGFTLQSNNSKATKFYASGKNKPYLEVKGEKKPSKIEYGKFNLTAQAVGNCLSNALRDTNPIYLEHLKGNKDTMSEIYKSQGNDGLVEYIAGLTEKYVAAHKDTLKISKFRRLENFDSKIDPSKEYRIALRTGVSEFEGQVDFDENGSFDYHLWSEMKDGHWAQKFGGISSYVLPTSSGTVSPGKFDWDASENYTDKFADFYKSKVVYFAVTKTTDKFTAHRGEK